MAINIRENIVNSKSVLTLRKYSTHKFFPARGANTKLPYVYALAMAHGHDSLRLKRPEQVIRFAFSCETVLLKLRQQQPSKLA
jgi:hypothetical protein